MEMGGTRASGQRQAVIRTLAGLAADDWGESDARPPLVLLHGLTFDRSLWRPALDELQRIDPGRRVLALDLPGHGVSPPWPSYDVASVASGVHRAVEEAQLQSPVVVGHSIGGVIATVYAARYPTRGVINVDQPLQVAPFAGLVRSLADKLRGPAFPAVWQMFAASMHIELLPDAGQRLVRASSQPLQDLVLGYWREILDRPASELADTVTATLAAVRTAGVPYLSHCRRRPGARLPGVADGDAAASDRHGVARKRPLPARRSSRPFRCVPRLRRLGREQRGDHRLGDEGAVTSYRPAALEA